MIIEIRDLPKDRKVKHITFDITFEEGGTTVVQQVQPPIQFNPEQKPSVDQVTQTEVERPVIPAERVHKDIPPEMTDMEF